MRGRLVPLREAGRCYPQDRDASWVQAMVRGAMGVGSQDRRGRAFSRD